MYPPEFNDKLKDRIRERDKWTCAICQEPGVHVHHINYIKTDCHELNLITLCEGCHPVTNGNRDEWRHILTKIVVGRPQLPQPRPRKKHIMTPYSRERMYEHQAEYRIRKKTGECVKWIRHSGTGTYSRVLVAAWGALRRKIYRNSVSYIAIPSGDDAMVVVSSLGKTGFPECDKTLHDLVSEWVSEVPSGKRMSRSKDVATFVKGEMGAS